VQKNKQNTHTKTKTKRIRMSRMLTALAVVLVVYTMSVAATRRMSVVELEDTSMALEHQRSMLDMMYPSCGAEAAHCPIPHGKCCGSTSCCAPSETCDLSAIEPSCIAVEDGMCVCVFSVVVVVVVVYK
jgi:hypothetical protein